MKRINIFFAILPMSLLLRQILVIVTVLMLPATSHALSLTGLHGWGSDASGNFVSGQEHSNTLTDGGTSFNLWVIQGGLGGQFINGPTDADAAIDVPLTTGVHHFTFHGTSFGAPSNFGLNRFFDGQTIVPSISVFSASDESAIGPDPAFFANSGTTLALLFLQTPGAGTLSFVSGQLEITLIDFVWSDPTVYALERVGGLSTGPDGQKRERRSVHPSGHRYS